MKVKHHTPNDMMDTDMRHLVLFLAAQAFLGIGAPQAQVVTEPLIDDQYHIVEIADGILRIDRQSGEITECRDNGSGWICRLSADDRQAYEAEINRLDLELNRLEEENSRLLAALEEATELGNAPSEPSVRERLELPSDEELDAVMDTAEEAMRRFFGLVQDLRREMEAERAQ